MVVAVVVVKDDIVVQYRRWVVLGTSRRSMFFLIYWFLAKGAVSQGVQPRSPRVHGGGGVGVGGRRRACSMFPADDNAATNHIGDGRMAQTSATSVLCLIVVMRVHRTFTTHTCFLSLPPLRRARPSHAHLQPKSIALLARINVNRIGTAFNKLYTLWRPFRAAALGCTERVPHQKSTYRTESGACLAKPRASSSMFKEGVTANTGG